MILITLWPFALALIASLFCLPTIISVANLKHLTDAPDTHRKLHKKITPTLGGIAIFAGTVFAFAAMTDYLAVRSEIQFMTSALILLFFAGVKDDIQGLSPVKKLMIQFFCGAALTAVGNMRITSLWGIFGVLEIPPLVGTIVTFILIVALINAFNLIDGIDGLAGGLGLIASLFFGTWFALTGNSFSSILAFSLSGALLGFLFFNFKNAKIFMGDTGSMLVGFIISILTIKFIEGNRVAEIASSIYYIKAAPGVAIAAVMVPLLDMTRLFFMRMLSGKNPFSADRNHIHHLLLDMGLSPVQAVLALYSGSLFFILLSLYLRDIRSFNLVLIIVASASVLKLIVLSLHKKSRAKDAVITQKV